MNPYEILGVSPQDDDAAVRNAYLALLRRFPPERHPNRFVDINRAYEAIKDTDSRLRHALFPDAPAERTPFEAALRHFTRSGERAPLDFETFRKYLQECAIR
jgi:curved DNA-binding protein CbpA